MANFNDFYLRPNPESTGQVPVTSGYLYTCPDIWPSGNKPIQNFQTTLVTEESYSQTSQSDIMLNYDNYIYIRGKNGADTPVTKWIELYYAPVAVINWPCQWYQNGLKTAKGRNYVIVKNVESGQIAVGDECLIWPNVQNPPSGSSHYCLIANVNDQNNSHPVPGTSGMTYEDMADLLTNDLRLGWRNTKIVEQDTPDWTYSQLLEIPDNVGENKTVRVALICPNDFAGAAVQFTSSTSNGSSGPIELKKTKIPQTGSSAVLGVEVDLDPGFSCSIQVNYWSNGIKPPSGKSIYLDASYRPQTQAEFDRAVNRNILSPHFAATMQNFQGRSYAKNITPYQPIQLGNIVYTFV